MSEDSGGRPPTEGNDANGGHPHRGGNRHRNNYNPTGEKSTGRCPELKGYMFDVPKGNQSDSFQKTIKEIGLYVARTLKNAGEYRLGLVDLELPEIVEPPEPADNASATKIKKWEFELKNYFDLKKNREHNQASVYAIVYGQCTTEMENRLNAEPDFAQISTNTDVIGLLKLIQKNATVKNSQQEQSHIVLDALTDFLTFRQDRLSDSDYLQLFKDKLEHAERVFGPIGHDAERVEDYLKQKHPRANSYSSEQTEKAKTACREAFLATTFLFRSDRRRYGDMQRKIKNDFTVSGTPYPKTLNAAVNILNQWVVLDRRALQQGNATFLQHDDDNENGSGKGNVWRKNKNGHKSGAKGGQQAKDSPGAKLEAGNSEMDQKNGATVNSKKQSENYPVSILDHTLHQAVAKNLPKSWIILDTASTVDMFMPDMLQDIHKAKEHINIVSTGGWSTVKEQGTLPGYPEKVWCNRSGVANILSFHNVQKHYRITYDNDEKDMFIVHLTDSDVMQFLPSGNGLYHLDTSPSHRGYSFVTTVKNQAAQYTPRGFEQAKIARRVENIIMRPGAQRFTNLVINNQIRNCPVERRHIQAAEDIFGPNIGSLKGKTPQRTIQHVTASTDPVPPEIIQKHGHVTISIDLMYINRVPFVITNSRDLRVGSIEDIPNRQIPTIKQALSRVLQKYEGRGFTIGSIVADDEFESLEQELPQYSFNIAGADDHVPEIERFIRTIKDSVPAQYNDLPFQYMPKAMLVHLARNAVFWWNALPHESSSLYPQSGRYVMDGRIIDYERHIRIPFGTYAQVHETHDNTMVPRTVGAICLGPTGNQQGTHYFLSLQTGRVLKRTNFTELPMPDNVIDRVSALGRQQGMPRSLTFGDRYGHVIHDGANEIDDDHDSDYDYSDADDDSLDGFSLSSNDLLDTPNPTASTAHTGVDNDVYPIRDGQNEDPQFHDDSSTAENIETEPCAPSDIGDTSEDEIIDDYIDDENKSQNTESHSHRSVEYSEESSSNSDTTGHDGAEDTMIKEAVENTGVDNNEVGQITATGMTLRPRKGKPNPSHIVGRGFEDKFQFLTAQMTAKRGLKHFGQKGAEAIVTEIKQLHQRSVIKPRMPHSLTTDQKRQALRYLMFLKQKRCGRIKARGCADGRIQRLWKSKEDTSSPTVRTESVFLSAIIDALERRDVATCNIPWAFLQADIDELVIVKFDAELASLLESIDPNTYSKFKVTEKGKDVMYVELQKALYGTLQAALLFWKELTNFLVNNLGFALNPYDNCIANKTINGKQCTILWHVDDLKISHVESTVVDTIIAQLNSRFGKEDPVSVTHGRIHNYLGMTLDYSVAGKVKISMKDFIARTLEELPTDMDGSATTPASSHLFEVNKNAVKLDRNTSEMFHTNVAKLLYLCKRARPDIHTSVAFLTTRVTQPDLDDYAKLRRCMRYLRATIDLPLTLEADLEGKVQWWVDASFATHPDMRSHTGAMVSLGKGAAATMSSRQKLNTKSSTEAELVGVDDAMSGVLWTRYFLTAQGYSVRDNVIYQDNQSTILLENNGTRSSGKRTRHINIRYYFITDRIKSNEVRIEYCPTENMLADLFTKPPRCREVNFEDCAMLS